MKTGTQMIKDDIFKAIMANKKLNILAMMTFQCLKLQKKQKKKEKKKNRQF